MLNCLKVLAALLLVTAYMLAIIIVFFIVAFAILWLVDGDYSTKTDDGSCKPGGEEDMNKDWLVQWHHTDGMYVNEHNTTALLTKQEALAKYDELHTKFLSEYKERIDKGLVFVEETDWMFVIKTDFEHELVTVMLLPF